MWAKLHFERTLRTVAARIVRADAALELPHTPS